MITVENSRMCSCGKQDMDISLGGLRSVTLNALSGILDSKSLGHARLRTICIEAVIRAAVEFGGSTGRLFAINSD